MKVSKVLILILLALLGLDYSAAFANEDCEQAFLDDVSSASTRASWREGYVESPAQTEARERFVSEFNAPGANAKYPKMRAELAQNHRTVRFVHESGRILPGARARVLLLHGHGASVSRGLSMTPILRSLVEPLPSSSSTVKALRQDPNYLPIAAEAIDQPGCGVGPELSNFADYRKAFAWLESYVADMRAETPNIPLFIFTRSSSAVLAVQLAQELAAKRPDLVDALILMSPTLPGDAELIEAGTKVVLAEAAAGEFTLNLPSLNWIDNVLKTLRWTPSTFRIPTMIFTGSLDPEMLPVEREAYTTFAQHNPLVSYTDVPGAVHNVLDTKKETKQGAMNTYRDILAFIRAVIEQKSPPR